LDRPLRTYVPHIAAPLTSFRLAHFHVLMPKSMGRRGLKGAMLETTRFHPGDWRRGGMASEGARAAAQVSIAPPLGIMEDQHEPQRYGCDCRATGRTTNSPAVRVDRCSSTSDNCVIRCKSRDGSTLWSNFRAARSGQPSRKGRNCGGRRDYCDRRGPAYASQRSP